MAKLNERIEDGLVNEGYTRVYTHTDEGGHEYTDHTHPVDTTHIIVTGAMEVLMDEKVYYLEKGDRLDVSADTKHSAHISEKGCTYVIGER